MSETSAESRTAVVTGGSRGIGRAIVTRLVRDGVRVVFSYRRDRDAANQLVALLGDAAHAVPMDLADPDQVRAFFAAADRHLGGLDIAVLNAGSVATGPVAELDESVYDSIMGANAKGTFIGLQEAARRLRDHGRIVAISSLNTAYPSPGNAVYSASKAAVEQFIAVAAKELGARQITANCVSPGATDTSTLRDANTVDALDMVARMTPLGRLGTSEDIADVVAFLAGPDGRWITGQNLPVNGGLR